MQIQPSAATLTIGESQEFHADRAVEWQLAPSAGELRKVDGSSVCYRAPRLIWISRNVKLEASANGDAVTAEILLSSAPCWIGALSVLWPAAALVLMASLFWIWPGSAPAVSAEVYPPVVTMAGGSSRQFFARVSNDRDQSVVWSSSDGMITPAGLFTAPRYPVGRVVITAARKSDPANTASALVLLGSPLSIAPPFAEIGPSKSIDLLPTSTDGQQADVDWFAAPSGVIAVANGHVTAGRTARPERVVVTARDRHDPQRQASAVVLVSPDYAGAVDFRARDRAIIALVLVMGALGAFLGASRSFANFVGNRTFRASWAVFYLFRPIFGAGLALLVFFGCSAGFVAILSSATADTSGAAFVSGVTGLFADTVLGKLKEVITALFPTDESRSDKMHSAGGTA